MCGLWNSITAARSVALVLCRCVWIRGRRREEGRPRAERGVRMGEAALQCWPLRDSSIQNVQSCSAPVAGWFMTLMENFSTLLATWQNTSAQQENHSTSPPPPTPPPSRNRTGVVFSPKNQEETAAFLYFAHYHQTKGSGDFSAGEGFNYSKAALAPVVCAPWINLFLRRPGEWLVTNSSQGSAGDIYHRSIWGNDCTPAGLQDWTQKTLLFNLLLVLLDIFSIRVPLSLKRQVRGDSLLLLHAL